MQAYKKIMLGGCALFAIAFTAPLSAQADHFTSYKKPLELYEGTAENSEHNHVHNHSGSRDLEHKSSSTSGKGYTLDVDFGEDEEPIDFVAKEEMESVESYPAPAAEDRRAVDFVPEEPLAPAMPMQEPVAMPMPVETPVPSYANGADLLANLQNVDCPPFTVLPEMRSITYFKDTLRDDLIARAKVNDISGTCRSVSGGIELDLTLSLNAELGNAGRYQSNKNAEEMQSFPYFVALTDNLGEVQYKKIFASIVRFPAHGDRTSKTERLTQFIPLQERGIYTVALGFQLSPQQLSYNKGQVLNVEPMQQPMSTSAAPQMIEDMEIQKGRDVAAVKSAAPAMQESPLHRRRFLSGRPRVSTNPLN